MCIPKMIHKCGIALGFDVCWVTAKVSTREGEGVVYILRPFIDVVVPAEDFMDVQT
jgi:hypothetical protein